MTNIVFDELLATMEVNDMTDEEKNALEVQFTETLENRILTRLLAILTEEQKKMLDDLKTQKEFEDFYEKNGISIKEISGEELVVLKEQLISNIAGLRGKRKA